ncbi:MAG: hypothetical protein H0W42_09645 [Gemmatimonadaceae bacterium]|nr:hypothetical protein [Gemmatimonadaceae bacterium]
MHAASKLAAAICFLGALTACAKSDDTPADTATVDTAAGAANLTPTPGMEGTPAAPSTSTGDALVHVPLTEWKVTVSKAAISPGVTTFHAMNQGTYTHAFEIEGNGKEWKSDPIAPGGTATLTPTLTAGTYEVYCPIMDSHGNHQQKGMRTTFTVR